MTLKTRRLMLRVNSNSKRSGRQAEGSRTRVVRLRILLSCWALTALLPLRLAGQAASTAPASGAMSVYGGGVQAPLQFQGQSLPANEVSLSMGASAFYDDNVLSFSTPRVGDEALAVDSRFGVIRRSGPMTLNFDYTPFFLFYRTYDQYDRLNHSADLTFTDRLTARTVLTLNDNFGYQNGMYGALLGEPILSGLPPPGGLNQTVVPYTTRTLQDTGGLGLRFEKSSRTSFILSGNFAAQKFGRQTATEPLYNSIGVGGSLAYQYAWTEHTNVGATVVHQDATFQGGQIFGNRLRQQIESMYFSLSSRLSPTVNVSVFGGPQYVRGIGQIAPTAVLAGHFQAAGGGTINKQVRKTAFDIAFQRSVSDGGGLYASAIYTSGTVGVRQRLIGRWEAGFNAAIGEGSASLFQSVNGKTDTVVGGVTVNRPLLRGSSFHVAYQTMHQVNKGVLPTLANLDRDQISVGIDYQLKAIPLGR